MRFNRRSVLGGIAASPAAMGAMLESAKMQAAGLSSMGAMAGAANAPSAGVPVASGASATKFFSFSDWLKGVGADIKQEASNVYALDADLVERRLPLATKVRLQRQRNYERILASKKTWFERAVSQRGFVEWWL